MRTAADCFHTAIFPENILHTLKRDVRYLPAHRTANLPWRTLCEATCLQVWVQLGMDILLKEEGVVVDKILGHGGFFKTKGVGQKVMAAAVNAPVSVMETAGEGGAWGIALLAAYRKNKAEGESLASYLEEQVFAKEESVQIAPDPKDVEGFEVFMDRYKEGLEIERAAVVHLH